MILIVDDEPNVSLYLRRFLEGRMHQVEVAASGEEAIETISRRPPALILLDVKMPGTDGLETLRRIRQRFGLIPTIMVTGVQEMDTAVACMKMGACDYIVKPIDFDYLDMSIRIKLAMSA